MALIPVEMKEDYLEEGKVICNQHFMIQLSHVSEIHFFRKSNGSDPENDESRSSKMVRASAITDHLIDII